MTQNQIVLGLVILGSTIGAAGFILGAVRLTRDAAAHNREEKLTQGESVGVFMMLGGVAIAIVCGMIALMVHVL